MGKRRCQRPLPAALGIFHDKDGGDIKPPTFGSNLNSEATYQGPAVGQYAIPDPIGGQGEGGEFTATATLKANLPGLIWRSRELNC